METHSYRNIIILDDALPTCGAEAARARSPGISSILMRLMLVDAVQERAHEPIFCHRCEEYSQTPFGSTIAAARFSYHHSISARPTPTRFPERKETDAREHSAATHVGVFASS